MQIVIVIVIKKADLVVRRVERAAAGILPVLHLSVFIAHVVVFKHHVLGVVKLGPLAFFIHRDRVELLVGLIPVVRVRAVRVPLIVFDKSIQDLQPAFILVIQDLLILLLRYHLIDEADLQVGIEFRRKAQRGLLAQLVDRLFHFDEFVQRLIQRSPGILDGLDGIAVLIFRAHADAGIADKVHLRIAAGDAAVGNAQIFLKEGIAGALLGVIGIHDPGMVFGEDRHDKGKKHDQDNNDRSHNGSPVLAEADPRVVEVADRLVVEFGIGQLRIQLGKTEYFFRNSIQIDLMFHNRHLAPMRMRGSRNP